MNPFAHYGIDHLSASSINLFTASPALFVLEKVLKQRTPVGAAAHRGTAVEAGVMLGLLEGAKDDACVALAEKTFAAKTALCGDPRKDKEGAGIGDMTRSALAELRPYGKPSSTQGKITHAVEGLHVPLIGFYDAEWAEHGILVDLKTTHKLPSEISVSHARQVALYIAGRGGNYEARITYATPKKCATYRLESPREHLRSIERIAMTIQRFLSVSKDPQELVGITAPDLSSFYFADPGARATAHAVWGV